jgi:hypothetical protein
VHTLAGILDLENQHILSMPFPKVSLNTDIYQETGNQGHKKLSMKKIHLQHLEN